MRSLLQQVRQRLLTCALLTTALPGFEGCSHEQCLLIMRTH